MSTATTTDDSPVYFLGIDIGTQGLTVLLTDADLHVVATADAPYGFVPDLPAGCYEQNTVDWERALDTACRKLARQVRRQDDDDDTTTSSPWRHLGAIGISGQMHGEVLLSKPQRSEDDDDDDGVLDPVRLWCDGRNADEARELTESLAVKCPQRMTAVRFLWTARHRPHRAATTRRITTPAGWLAWKLTGRVLLGVGDASGVFPVDAKTGRYDAERLRRYDELLSSCTSPPSETRKLQDLLPQIVRAGEDAGNVTVEGAALLAGLLCAEEEEDETTTTTRCLVGVPVAGPEGDQVAALAGSLVGRPGTVACSFGTSVCANVVATRSDDSFVSSAVDHFCAADGRPIHMVWLRNGTTFFNTAVTAFRRDDETASEAFTRLMPLVLRASPDCDGLLALPFMDDEPGLHVATGPSTALTLGWTASNATPGNVILAALVATMMNLKAGVRILEEHKVVELKQIVLSGGLVKTPELGQILANVFDCPVRLLAAADEGSSWGAAVMAAYRYECFQNNNDNADQRSWSTFLQDVARGRPEPTQFTPQPDAVRAYQRVYSKYQKLRTLERSLRDLQRDDDDEKQAGE